MTADSRVGTERRGTAMKRLGILLFLISLSCTLVSCGGPGAREVTPSPDYDYSKVVAGIVKLHEEADGEWRKNHQVYKHAGPDPLSRLPGEFDPNAYFGVLKHLSMDDDLVLDFAYLYGADGRPFLYTRHRSAEPYETFGEYDAALGGQWYAMQAQMRAILGQAHREESGKNLFEAIEECDNFFAEHGEPMLGSRAVYDADKDFLSKVRADGSPESFFEFAVLYELGGQFYLEFHFCSDDTRIVASSGDVDQVIEDHEGFSVGHGLPFTEEQEREASRIDATPRVRLVDRDTAEVTLVTFSDWGGFVRNTYRIRRTFPHTITVVRRETLVEYDCGGVI
jgi:hypothetical protein